MKPLIEAENSAGEKIMVDLNDVVLNPAGTNMTVATYPEKNLNVGNKKPVYENYKSLRLLPHDRETVEEVFKLKVAIRAANKRNKETSLRKTKKTKKKVSPA